MMALHIYTAEATRVERMCPLHKQMEGAQRQEYYDGVRFTFDCGVHTDGDYWYPPATRLCEICNKDVAWGYWRRHVMTRRHVAKAGAA